jgi:ribonuclease J
VNSTQADSEEYVKEVAKQRVEKTNGLVVVNFPARDTDRMQSFFQVAHQTDRALVINLKQAYRLELFNASGIGTRRIDDDNLRLIPRKMGGVYTDDWFSEKIQRKDYDYWERDYLDHAKTVTARDIRENQNAYVFAVTSSSSKS